VILTGAALLALACALAPLSPDLAPLSASLLLLGLGWNFCYVGGSTLLSDQLSQAERAKTQGTSDMLVGLSTAMVSLVSGAIFASVGFTAIGIVGALASLLLLGLTGWWMAKGRRPAIAWP
jgi:MFS family permease